MMTPSTELSLFLLLLTSCHLFMLGNVIFQECLSFISAFVVKMSWGCWECASNALLLFVLRCCPCAAEGNKSDQQSCHTELPHFSLSEGPNAVNSSCGLLFLSMCFAFLWIVMGITPRTSQSVLPLSMSLMPSVCILG